MDFDQRERRNRKQSRVRLWTALPHVPPPHINTTQNSKIQYDMTSWSLLISSECLRFTLSTVILFNIDLSLLIPPLSSNPLLPVYKSFPYTLSFTTNTLLLWSGPTHGWTLSQFYYAIPITGFTISNALLQTSQNYTWPLLGIGTFKYSYNFVFFLRRKNITSKTGMEFFLQNKILFLEQRHQCLQGQSLNNISLEIK